MYNYSQNLAYTNVNNKNRQKKEYKYIYWKNTFLFVYLTNNL